MAINATNMGGELDSPLAFATAQRDKNVHQMIENAIRQKDVLLAYQPVVAARNPKIPAFYEGLIRIMDEDHNVLPAGDFMPVAETREVGRIIDCLALEIGLQTLLEEPNIRLSINMSARSIGYQRWTEVLNQGLARDGTIAERLILEITESSAMVMPDLVTVFMADMHRRGISFALDDFGAGFTAFRYLKEFYFDIVKIDGSFIRNIHEDANNQVLTSALVSISQHFDMLTVAEAVEQPEEAAFLQSAGLDCLQGYYFGMPTINPVWQKESESRAKS
ncbi:MAG: EAL domain-containing protein (putative c-di-GMP-specific phosphodiesterase class I) [Paracoccaceae bacterium]|jgi:EAL domain-containing protein (putative c-di-GMP-specific phosphodiesterase class I)